VRLDVPLQHQQLHLHVTDGAEVLQHKHSPLP
jgi:hypothetical protein